MSTETLNVVAVYIPPSNAPSKPCNADHFQAIGAALAETTERKNSFVFGDFNARIYGGSPLVIDNNETSNQGPTRVKLSNVDRPETCPNSRGQELIQFCNVHGLTPLNGLQVFW